MTERIYTLEEIRELLKVTRRSLYNFIKEGRLEAFKIGREWRVTEKALKDFMRGDHN